MTGTSVAVRTHICQDEIDSFLKTFWYGIRRRVLPPHVGTLMRCDCGLLFQLQPDSTWLEGEWNWADPSSGLASFSPASA